MNTGQRTLNNYDQFNGNKDLMEITGRVAQKGQQVENFNRAATEFELAETALSSMKDLMDTIKVDALQGSNDTYGSDDLAILGEQLRNLGENVYSIANTKLGDKYIFAGLQSDKQVIKFSSGDLFGNAIYKEGFGDIGNRKVEKQQASVSLGEIFNQNAAPATFAGNAFVVPLAGPAQVNITINDGAQDLYLGDIDFNAGDTMPAIIANINAAFTAAGGLGTIVQDGGGFLEFDTSLITGNVENSIASVIISDGTTATANLASLGLQETTQFGNSKDLRQTLGELDSAYFSGDNQRVRNSLADVQKNIDRLVEVISQIGSHHQEFLEKVDRESYNLENLEIQQANINQIPAAEAAQNVSSAQTILQYTMQLSSRIMQQNIFDFLR